MSYYIYMTCNMFDAFNLTIHFSIIHLERQFVLVSISLYLYQPTCVAIYIMINTLCVLLLEVWVYSGSYFESRIIKWFLKAWKLRSPNTLKESTHLLMFKAFLTWNKNHLLYFWLWVDINEYWLVNVRLIQFWYKAIIWQCLLRIMFPFTRPSDTGLSVSFTVSCYSVSSSNI